MGQNILFLCYGNICRSPFCERYWNLHSQGPPAKSAGFIQTEDRATPSQYQEMAAAHGVDLRDHGSAWADPDLVDWADSIVVMDEHNLGDLRSHYPEAEEKTTLLGSFHEPPLAEIEDPYYLSPPKAQEVYAQMAAALDQLLEEWS